MSTTELTELTDVEVNKALTLHVPDDTRHARRAAMFLTLVNDMSVATREDYELASSELRSIKQAWDTMEAERTSFTVPLNAVLDKLNARFQPHLKTLKAAESIIKGKIAAFLADEAKRAAEARALAERDAEAERVRLEQQAEELRAQAAQQASPAARERLEQQAAALAQTAAVVIAQPVAAPAHKGDGISQSKAVDFEITDMLAWVRFIANERPDLIVLLKSDDVKTRAMVKMLGLATSMPGLRVFPKTSISVR